MIQDNPENIITTHPITPNETVQQTHVVNKSTQNNIDNANVQNDIINNETSESVNEFSGPVNSENTNVQGQTEHTTTNEETHASNNNTTGNENIELPNIQSTALPNTDIQGSRENEINEDNGCPRRNTKPPVKLNIIMNNNKKY